jgi:plastocyanin
LFGIVIRYGRQSPMLAPIDQSTIKNFAFIPRNFTVSPGAVVTVRNEDQMVHTLTADNGRSTPAT